MWGRPTDAPTIPWPDAEARLLATEEYWLISVQADGSPTPRPVWGVWLDDRLLLTVGSTSHWRGISANPEVAVHLGDPLSVVIVQGRASKLKRKDVFHQYVEDFNSKYSWNFDAANPMVADGTLEVLPSVVLAWNTSPAPECVPDMTFPSAAGRWTFG